MTRAHHASAHGRRHALWAVREASPNDRTSPLVVSLDASSHSLPPGATRVVVDVTVCHQLAFYFISFLFSLFPKKYEFVLFCSLFQFQSLFFWFLIFFWSFYRNFICFQLSPSISIWHIFFSSLVPIVLISNFFWNHRKNDSILKRNFKKNGKRVLSRFSRGLFLIG